MDIYKDYNSNFILFVLIQAETLFRDTGAQDKTNKQVKTLNWFFSRYKSVNYQSRICFLNNKIWKRKQISLFYFLTSTYDLRFTMHLQQSKNISFMYVRTTKEAQIKPNCTSKTLTVKTNVSQ